MHYLLEGSKAQLLLSDDNLHSVTDREPSNGLEQSRRAVDFVDHNSEQVLQDLRWVCNTTTTVSIISAKYLP